MIAAKNDVERLGSYKKLIRDYAFEGIILVTQQHQAQGKIILLWPEINAEKL